MPYIFGKEITYYFNPIEDNEYIDLQAASLVSAYVYADKPSTEAAAAGSGTVIETISSWATGIHGGKKLTVAALDDPNSTSSTSTETHWLAVNFKFEAGEQTQTIIRAIPLERATVHHKPPTVSKADLEAIFGNIGTFRNDTLQDSAIELATDRIADELTSKGFEWSSIWRPDKLKYTISYRALEMLMLQLVVAEGENWIWLYDTYKQIAQDSLESLKIQYDPNQAGEPTEEVQYSTSMRIMR